LLPVCSERWLGTEVEANAQNLGFGGNRMIISRRTTLITLFTLLLPASVFASPIFGTFDIGGSNATVSATMLNFLCSGGLTVPCPPPAPLPATDGNFNVTSGTGDFAGLVPPGGYIHDIDQTSTPPPGPFLLPDFIVFPAFPAGTHVNLTTLFLGVSGQADCGSSAPGKTCTPSIPALVSPTNPLGLSPFNLQNIAGGGSTASFSMAGKIINAAGEESDFFGTFTSQFTVPYTSYLPTIATGGSVTNSYSATFIVTPIPEPGTESLAIGTLLVLAGYGFRRKLRSGKAVH
jgi:hypothetical protein